MSSFEELTEAERFFYGGTVLVPNSSVTPNEGMVRVAQELAKAELAAVILGWWAVAETDFDVQVEDATDIDTAAAIYRGELFHLQVTLYGPPTDGDTLLDRHPTVLLTTRRVIVDNLDHPYLRVVSAEMASDLLGLER